MISNKQTKLIRSLRQSKFRQKYDIFIVEGDKSCIEFLRSKTYKIIQAYCSQEWADKNREVLLHYNKLTEIVSEKEMRSISLLQTPSPVLLICEKSQENVKAELLIDGYSIYLDKVQDPGNVGTIIRIADWFGFNAVIRSPDSADFYNPKVVQATMGSMVNVALYTSSYTDLKKMNKNLVSFGACMDGIPIREVEWPGNAVLVIGNESKGINSEIADILDYKITIPGTDNRVAESLNASVATGIIAAAIASSLSLQK